MSYNHAKSIILKRIVFKLLKKGFSIPDTWNYSLKSSHFMLNYNEKSSPLPYEWLTYLTSKIKLSFWAHPFLIFKDSTILYIFCPNFTLHEGEVNDSYNVAYVRCNFFVEYNCHIFQIFKPFWITSSNYYEKTLITGNFFKVL